jgi:hypothetical protein
MFQFIKNKLKIVFLNSFINFEKLKNFINFCGISVNNEKAAQIQKVKFDVYSAKKVSQYFNIINKSIV